MNKEIVKAMNKKEKKEPSKFIKWWRKNDYKVYRVIFFYIWLPMCLKEKIVKKLNSRNRWDSDRAKEILDYYIPRKSKWDDIEKEFYFFDNGWGWSSSYTKKSIKFKDRRFWSLNARCYGGDIRHYLIEEYELEGFTKEVLDTSDGWTEITFKLNN